MDRTVVWQFEGAGHACQYLMHPNESIRRDSANVVRASILQALFDSEPAPEAVEQIVVERNSLESER